MTNWRPDFDPDHLYFITTKAIDYAHLFQRDLAKRLLVDTLDCMHLRQQMALYASIIKDLIRELRRPPHSPVSGRKQPASSEILGS
jgi:hypothetical protein